MTRSPGNTKLKAARVASGYASQLALAEALTRAAPEIGLRGVTVGSRQVRRWESANPPWPLAPQQQLLRHVLGVSVEELGFVPPWESVDATRELDVPIENPHDAPPSRAMSPVSIKNSRHVEHDAETADGIGSITKFHRRMYWRTDPLILHPAVIEHLHFGQALLQECEGVVRSKICTSMAETALLAGRIEFFDLRKPGAAAENFIRSLQFASDAQDALLGAAALAHSAFVPGWAGDREGASDRLAAARAHARRGDASSQMFAWFDAVEAECLTRCGDPKAALNLIDRAESYQRSAKPGETSPAWMDWFSPVRLLAFKGNTQLAAGNRRRARETLTQAVAELPEVDSKQRAVILADLAAVEVADQNPEKACALIAQALDQLAQTWYSTAMDRVRTVRRGLRPWQNEDFMKDLDDRLFDWQGAFNAVRS